MAQSHYPELELQVLLYVPALPVELHGHLRACHGGARRFLQVPRLRWCPAPLRLYRPIAAHVWIDTVTQISVARIVLYSYC